MSDDPLTDKDAAAIEQWAYASESRVRLRVRRLLRDLEATRADLAAETATREALRTQEARISGLLADAGVPVGDLVAGVAALVAERDRQTRRGDDALDERDEMREARDRALAEIGRLRAEVTRERAIAMLSLGLLTAEQRARLDAAIARATR